MIIIGCSHGVHVAERIARLARKEYSELLVKKFPDGESDLCFMCDVQGKVVVLVQSFYHDINDALIEVFLAAHTAKDLGAKRVVLMAPYFPYFRQDTRFHPGECVSLPILGKFVDACLSEIYVMDPHLHREKTLKHVFRVRAHKLTANGLVRDYIKKHIKKPIIIGPDWESYKWARATAEMIGCESAILKKTRYSSRRVEVALDREVDLGKKNVVIVDDIISTGHTLLETIKLLRRDLGAKKITCIGIHGVFAESALTKLKRAKVDVITTNTIPNAAAKIDVAKEFAERLR